MIVAEGAMKMRPTTIAEAELKLKEELEPNVIEESEAKGKKTPVQSMPSSNTLVKQILESKLVFKAARRS